jgi:nucleotide-binding universal stress UspA family protein
MAYFPKRLVVVPVDFSEESLAAVAVGRQLVDSPEHLHIIHILIDVAPLEAGEVWGVIDQQPRLEQAEKSLREKLSAPEYQGAKLAVLLGEPAHGIADYAQDKHAELIVIPSHGRTGITRLLIGSVAERVIRLAHCPVLVLRK